MARDVMPGPSAPDALETFTTPNHPVDNLETTSETHDEKDAVATATSCGAQTRAFMRQITGAFSTYPSSPGVIYQKCSSSDHNSDLVAALYSHQNQRT